MRVGYIHDWKSNWFSEKNFSDFLIEDVRIRDHITGKLAHAGLSDITIRKDAAEVEVNIHTARPGIVIGKSGSEVDALRRDLHRMTGKSIKVNILEIKRPELDAKLVAQSIAEQLVNRVAPPGYVATGPSLTPLDTAAKSAGTPIPVGADSEAVAITPGGATAFVTNPTAGTVTPVDLSAGTAAT